MLDRDESIAFIAIRSQRLTKILTHEIPIRKWEKSFETLCDKHIFDFTRPLRGRKVGHFSKYKHRSIPVIVPGNP